MEWAGEAQGNGEWEDRAGTGHELGRWGKRAGGQKGMGTRGETEYAGTKGGKGEEDTWGRVNGINGKAYRSKGGIWEEGMGGRVHMGFGRDLSRFVEISDLSRLEICRDVSRCHRCP